MAGLLRRAARAPTCPIRAPCEALSPLLVSASSVRLLARRKRGGSHGPSLPRPQHHSRRLMGLAQRPVGPLLHPWKSRLISPLTKAKQWQELIAAGMDQAGI